MFYAWRNDGLNDIQNDQPLYFHFVLKKCICFLKWKLTCFSKAKLSGFPPHSYCEFLIFLIKKTTILSSHSTGGLVFSRKKVCSLCGTNLLFVYNISVLTNEQNLPAVTLSRLHNWFSYLWADLIHLSMPIKEY